MPLKMTGAEFKRFWSDETVFQAGRFYVDDDSYRINGEEVLGCDLEPDRLTDNAKVVVESGVLVTAKTSESVDLLSCIRRWQKSISTVAVVVECPRERTAELKALLAAHKFKSL